MSKVIYAKLPTKIVGRVCLNCGTDINHKRHDAKFCSATCAIAYNMRKKKNA